MMKRTQAKTLNFARYMVPLFGALLLAGFAQKSHAVDLYVHHDAAYPQYTRADGNYYAGYAVCPYGTYKYQATYRWTDVGVTKRTIVSGTGYTSSVLLGHVDPGTWVYLTAYTMCKLSNGVSSNVWTLLGYDQDYWYP